MVSGVSFKNPSAKTQVRHKRRTSTGLLASFLILFIVGLTYAGVTYYGSALSATNDDLKAVHAENEQKIASLLAGEPAAFVARSRAVSTTLQREATTESVLLELHKLAVPGVVFQSFDHVYDRQTGENLLTIQADANEFTIIAAQINQWKQSKIFSSVTVGDLTRDEETGFVLFTAKFDLAPSENGPFVDVISMEDSKPVTDPSLDTAENL